MKTSVYEELKVRKPFEFNDIFLYSFILMLCLALFLFFIPRSSASSDGFKIIWDGKTVFSLSYADNSYNVDDSFPYELLVDTEKSTVTIFFSEDKSEYNLLSYDLSEKSVKVVESSCSDTKECTRIPAVKNDNGAIYCTPHKIKIVSLSYKQGDTPVTGA